MIKEIYKDLPDEEFVPLECFEYLDERFKGNYEINKLGWIKTTSTGNIRRSIKSINGVYPTITLTTPGYRTTYLIHKLVALTFLEKEEGKPVIDHISRNIEDYSIYNLRYNTVSGNQRNRKISPNEYVLSEYGKDRFLISRKVIHTEDYPENFIKGVFNSQRNQKLYKGSYWTIENKELLDYSEKYPYPIEKSRWKPLLRLPEYQISDNGYIKDKNGTIRIGYKGSYGYRRIELSGTSYRIHRLVYETFVLGRLLKEDEYVDHISTVTDQNEISNLRLVNQEENMNNYNTRVKSTKGEILQYDLKGNFIKEFKNSIDIENSGFNRRKVTSCCSSPDVLTVDGFIWAYKNHNEKELKDKISRVLEIYRDIYQYDLSGNFIRSFSSGELKKQKTPMEYKLLISACSGRGKDKNYYYKGYYWCYENNVKDLKNFILQRDKKSYKNKWKSKEQCSKEASKYSRRIDFQKGSGGAYRASIRYGWIDEFFPKN